MPDDANSDEAITNEDNDATTTDDRVKGVAEALRKTAGGDGAPPTHEHIETHISHLFLTDSYVFKLKKPVDFGFLDYSSPEKRKSACEAELEINRRLGSDVYIDVESLGRDETGHWRIGYPADMKTVVDWMVKMRRLPDDRCLKRLIMEGHVASADIDAVVELLVKFYSQLQPVRQLGYCDRVMKHVRDNQSTLEQPQYEMPQEIVQRIHAAQRQFLFLNSAQMQQRVDDGRVVEGHGDLRAEHVYMTRPPVVIDGIEFSRELRTVDVADELSFFAVTCEILDHREIGEQVLEGVSERLADHPTPRLLSFYRSYRACVRAKVMALQSSQADDEEHRNQRRRARTYLEIADRHASLLGPPVAVVVRGFSGTGKSTLARMIADQLGAVHLATDQIRKSHETSHGVSDMYSDAARREIYDAMSQRAIQLVGTRQPVVLDGTFLDVTLMSNSVMSLAQSGALVTVITCECPDDVAIQRIEQRRLEGRSESDATVDVYRRQRELSRPIPTDLTANQCTIDTTASESQQIQRVRSSLAH